LERDGGMKMETDSMNMLLGGSTSVFIRIFIKKKDFVSPPPETKKSMVGKIRNTMFLISPTALLPEKRNELCKNVTGASVMYE
jgi:hypothetical protein